MIATIVKRKNVFGNNDLWWGRNKKIDASKIHFKNVDYLRVSDLSLDKILR